MIAEEGRGHGPGGRAEALSACMEATLKFRDRETPECGKQLLQGS